MKVLYGEIKRGDTFREKVDWNRRNLIRKNHSATHLLQKALQEIVSPEIHQEGAYYDDERLRFDFNADEKLSQDTLDSIEKRINEKIFASLPVKTEILKKEDALKKNARHLFGEKYGDVVRVVSMGDYSTEFCGGTHVDNTKDIDLFAIVQEESVAAGIRRITAYTGEKAYDFFKEKQGRILEAAKLLGVTSDKAVRNKIVNDKENVTALNATIKALREESTNAIFASLEASRKENNGHKVLVSTLKGLTHEQLDSLSHKLIDKHADLVLFLAVDNGEKKDLVAAKGKNLASFKAGRIRKEVSKILNGRGGGREDVAFGGTSSLANLEEAKKYLFSL